MGTPSGPSCQAQRANLSTSSPVSPPNSSASALAWAGTECTAKTSASCPRRYVRLLCERPMRNRGGSMLSCVAKPIRQPRGSPSTLVVTMNIGYSRSPTIASNVARTLAWYPRMATPWRSRPYCLTSSTAPIVARWCWVSVEIRPLEGQADAKHRNTRCADGGRARRRAVRARERARRHEARRDHHPRDERDADGRDAQRGRQPQRRRDDLRVPVRDHAALRGPDRRP